jgi:hypothetical protein
MQDPAKINKLLPLMREYGGLERKRVGEGVTPLEYQRWLDLRAKIGSNVERPPSQTPEVYERRRAERRPTRLLAVYESRNALIDAIITNISPAGLFLATPFTAPVGTKLLVRVHLEKTGEDVEIPCTVVTSIGENIHTLGSTNMGMGLKFDKLDATQAAAVSEIFEGALDDRVTLKS